MRVFRVGHRWHTRSHLNTPTGPYAFGWTDFPDYVAERVNAMRWCHQGDTHPSPREDGLGQIDRWEVCGFSSLDALHAWFEHHWRLRLHQVGYRITEYDVPEDHVRQGGFQVVFTASQATPKRHHTLAHGCDVPHGGEDPEEDRLCTSTYMLAAGSWCRNPQSEDVIHRPIRRPFRAADTR
ncbi:hypothetical protein ACFW6C_07630 [Streptomyces fungicidicus]|uniref:hypothetical protein n=1 Tax=Streptomyces fungicidicus TaxID=68203 RepID=UPI003678B3DE